MEQVPSIEEFNRVFDELARGTPLNLAMIGKIFGQRFWELLVLMQTNINVTSEGKIEVNIYCEVKEH